jgi:Flp pilus assembly protein TadG
MVEFLISVPFMLLLFAAVSEFGIIFYTQTTLNKAVNDSVRFLSASTLDNLGDTVITPQVRTNAANLVVYGTITTDPPPQPLVDGLVTADVTISCLYGATPHANGTQCTESAVIPSLAAISVEVEVQYTPVLGGMLEAFTGVNVDIPLRASAINVSLSTGF